uniref:Cytochrome c oxidase assembly factor 3 n=1 Tax=Timema tahoe TaxID=61484 RepID=A0A7R9IC41_9NEOP|nr:unnamed protein product [Timema tahoe]
MAAGEVVHPTEIRTSIFTSSAVELNTISALANYATEAAPLAGCCFNDVTRPFKVERSTSHQGHLKKVIGRMADKESMPRVDFEKDKAKFKNTAIDYIKLIEKLNLERVQKLQRIRRNNIITGCVLGGSVLGIYVYSMYSVKQEKFLDDFDEPATTSN